MSTPPGASTRPTSDRAREAIFNALGSRGLVDGAAVLDLFAGSGAMGIEALSRGADHAVFVDVDARARRVVAANLAACGLADRGEVVTASADQLLTRLSAEGRRFTVAFCDPPYRFDGWTELLPRVPAGLVVLEAGAPVVLPEGWALVREARYGAAWVGFAVPPEPGRAG